MLTPGGKNADAVALSKKGGAKGSPARAKALTLKRRSEIAKRTLRQDGISRRTLLGFHHFPNWL
jgi:hypothetical protein